MIRRLRMLRKKKAHPTKYISLPKCPTGISGFDEITLGGLPSNRSTLICGGAGSGKSMFGMEFLIAGAALYKEPGLFVAFKETVLYNLDGLFVWLANAIDKYKIKRVVLDTLEILFANLSNKFILRAELQRLFRWFKTKKVTLVVTAEQGIDTFTRYGLEEYVADC